MLGWDCWLCEATLTKSNTQDWEAEGGCCDECCEREADRYAERVIDEQRDELTISYYRGN